MGRQVINSIECGKCHKEFDVATEDIEWEHLNDAGETEDDSTMHDFNVFQTIKCPHCGKENKIVMEAKGKSGAEINQIQVLSLKP